MMWLVWTPEQRLIHWSDFLTAGMERPAAAATAVAGALVTAAASTGRDGAGPGMPLNTSSCIEAFCSSTVNLCHLAGAHIKSDCLTACGCMQNCIHAGGSLRERAAGGYCRENH